MALKTSEDTYLATVAGGEKRAAQSLSKTMVLSFLGGCYISIGGFWALLATGSMPGDVWGTLGKLFFGMLFPIGLMLIIMTGTELFTGNCMTLAAAWYERKVGALAVLRGWVLSWLGNFAGGVFFAYFMAYLSGLILANAGAAEKIVLMANMKCTLPFMETFWRGILANWLVCLAVYLAMTSDTLVNKTVGLWIPVAAFVTLGGEHCIANMFFVPLGLFTGADAAYTGAALTVGWGDFLITNLVPATLGNIVGGAVFVALAYKLATGK